MQSFALWGRFSSMYQFVCLAEYWKMWQDMTVTFKLLRWKPDATDASWYFIMLRGSECSPYAYNLHFSVTSASWKSTGKKKSLAMIRNAGSREKNTQCLTWSGYLMWKIAMGTFLLFEYDAKHFALQMCFNELIHLVIKPYCLIDLPPLCCYIKNLCIRAGWLH